MPLKSPSNPKSKLSKTVKIGILHGGHSSERDISLLSGRAVHNALIQRGLEPVLLDPARQKSFQKHLLQVDVAFIALHGAGGEDGQIQRTLEKLKIPYVGSSFHSSRRAFNKLKAKKAFLKACIPTPVFTVINRKNWKRKLTKLTPPLFFKPFCDGSSIGVFPVEDFEKSAVMIKKALSRYSELLVEKKIDGREFTVGILGNRALPVIELKPKNPFYDYEAKYTKGMTEYLVPAPISGKLARKLQSVAMAAHRCLELRDFSRVDIMVDHRQRPFVLEVNSIPGFTEFSLLPKAARAAGVEFPDLCRRLALNSLSKDPYKRVRKVSRNGKKKA